MAKRSVERDNLELVANAIRTKDGTGSTLKFPDGFVSSITNMKIPSKCRSGNISVAYSSGDINLTIPVTDIDNVQTILLYIRGVSSWPDKNILTVLMIIMNDDGSVFATYAFWCNEVTGGYRHYDMNNDNYSYDDDFVTKTDEGIVINNDNTGYGYFYGNYDYYVYGY